MLCLNSWYIDFPTSLGQSRTEIIGELLGKLDPDYCGFTLFNAMTLNYLKNGNCIYPCHDVESLFEVSGTVLKYISVSTYVEWHNVGHWAFHQKMTWYFIYDTWQITWPGKLSLKLTNIMCDSWHNLRGITYLFLSTTSNSKIMSHEVEGTWPRLCVGFTICHSWQRRQLPYRWRHSTKYSGCSFRLSPSFPPSSYKKDARKPRKDR